MHDELLIGEVAELFNVTTKTLRHYEKLGLLAPERAENGYRLYDPQDVLRLRRIRQLQSLGLPLRKIRRVLKRQDDERLWEALLHSLREEATAEMAVLEERLERIERLLAEGMPPDREDLPSTPEKVDDYLEQHLPQAMLGQWRRDRTIYAALQIYLNPSLPGRLMEPPSTGEKGLPPFTRSPQPHMIPSHGRLAPFNAPAIQRSPVESAGGTAKLLRLLEREMRWEHEEDECS